MIYLITFNRRQFADKTIYEKNVFWKKIQKKTKGSRDRPVGYHYDLLDRTPCTRLAESRIMRQ